MPKFTELISEVPGIETYTCLTPNFGLLTTKAQTNNNNNKKQQQMNYVSLK